MQVELDLYTQSTNHSCKNEFPGFVFEYSARMTQSWRVKKQGERYVVRVPKVIEIGSIEIKRALCEWTLLSYARKTEKNRVERKALERTIFAAIEQRIQECASQKKSRKERSFNTGGTAHDLQKLFDEVNRTFFDGKIAASITWSSRVGGTSFHSKRISPATGKKYDLISISRGYDNSNCPEYAIKGVIYHEMLHIAIPPRSGSVRRNVHSKEFRAAEKEYPYYKEWITWHGTTLRKNISALKRTPHTSSIKKKILSLFR